MPTMFRIPQRWRYLWWHIPTGKRGEATTLREMTAYEFDACLRSWNWKGGDDWKYTVAPGQPLPAAPENVEAGP